MKKLVVVLAAALVSAGAYAQSPTVVAQSESSAISMSEGSAISTKDTVSRHHRPRHHHRVRHVVRR